MVHASHPSTASSSADVAGSSSVPSSTVTVHASGVADTAQLGVEVPTLSTDATIVGATTMTQSQQTTTIAAPTSGTATGTSNASSDPINSEHLNAITTACPDLATILQKPPSRITTASELQAMKSGEHYRLTGDITLPTIHAPNYIDSDSDPGSVLASGVYRYTSGVVIDGGGFTISGFNIDLDYATIDLSRYGNANYIGLFAKLRCSIVHNLKFAAPSIMTPAEFQRVHSLQRYNYLGIIAGIGVNTLFSRVEIRNVNMRGAASFAGGIFGFADGDHTSRPAAGLTIIDSTSITGTASNIATTGTGAVGGILGEATFGHVAVTNTTTEINVQTIGTGSPANWAGGLFGTIYYSVSLDINRVENHGSINSMFGAGGLTGRIERSLGKVDARPMRIQHFTNFGTVSGRVAGGLVGEWWQGHESEADLQPQRLICIDCRSQGEARPVVPQAYAGSLIGRILFDSSTYSIDRFNISLSESSLPPPMVAACEASALPIASAYFGETSMYVGTPVTCPL